LIDVGRLKAALKTAFEQLQENYGATEQEIITSFEDDRIKENFPQSGATVFTNYSAISRLEETPNMFVLRTKTKQVIVVNKTDLIQEQKNEEFIQFIRNKCENVKIRVKTLNGS
jgi:DNA-binding LytR/AlgR family response regulator